MQKAKHFSKISFIIILGCWLILSCSPIKKTGAYPGYVYKVPTREYTKLKESQIDSLQIIYGESKQFIEEFKEASLIALSHYPELKNTKIIFSYSKESTTMAARPKIISLFGKRSYLILINKDKNFKGIHLEDVPFNAQVGIIGHELAHIFDYEQKTLWGIILTGINLTDKKKKSDFERDIDLLAIKKGLGWQLYDWAQFSMFLTDKASEKYKEFKRETYMNPYEIEDNIIFID